MQFRLPKVRGKYREDADLSKLCWFQVGGKAKVLFIPEDLEDLVHFLSARPTEIPIFVLGVGSNTLISDKGFKRSVVIRLGKGFNYIRHEGNLVTAGAASMSLNVAFYAAEHGLAALEFLSGIPGTIGGAIAMNAGAYNADTASRLTQAKAVNRQGLVKIFSNEEIGYYYRGNSLGSDWIFIEGEFAAKPGVRDDIKKRVREIQERRLLTQPIKSKTCGSTFKNPSGLKAWELIEKAGCQGLRVGGAQISEQHCNFIINNGSATAQDILELINTVKLKVQEATGVLLIEEIKIVGDE